MAGAGYKLFNTGDVLTAAQVNTYLMEQTVMVFNDAASRTTALSGVVAEGMLSYLKSTKQVEVYNGTAWVASDDPNAIQNTIVDAKGDLIAATAADVPARLAVGNNGETLVADSSATTGLRWSAGNPQGNPVLNSAMQVWQRGTSISVPQVTYAYTADRWALATSNNQASTLSRQLTNDTTNLPMIQYCARIQRNSGQTGTGQLFFVQPFETINTIPYVGKTVTLSFYARAGANYSSASNVLKTYIVTGTGTDQNWLVTGYTGTAVAIDGTATLTSNWQRFTFTGTIATSVTEMSISTWYQPTGTAGANDYYEITGVQLDVGSVALPFRTYSATLAGELAACQRYYYRLTGVSGGTSPLGVGISSSTTTALVTIPNPVQMRITPNALDYSSVAVTNCTTYTNTASNLILEAANPHVVRLTATATGQTSNQPVNLLANANGYIGLSAEL